MTNPVSWAVARIKDMNDAVWHTPLSELPKGRTVIIKQLRIIIVAARGVLNNRVQLRAASLTLYSLLSVIPVVAIAFAIAKGFGLDRNLETLIADEFQSQQEILNWLLQNARSALEKTRGGYIAGVGMVILFWSVMSLLGHVEDSFNHIWQIRSPRAWYRKFTDYLTIMLIAPVFLILASSMSVFISAYMAEFMTQAPVLDYFKPLVTFLLKLSPYFLVWVILTIVYLVMPNTKVKFMPAMISGIIVGTALQILQYFYIDLQFGITKLNAIYGSFAAVPLFIIWLQYSWLTILLGAELAFANQNISNYEFEAEAMGMSNYHRKAIFLIIMNIVIKKFAAGERPVSASDIAVQLKVPIRLVRELLQDLNEANLVSEITLNDEKERFYQPALDIGKITVSYVLSKVEKHGIRQVFLEKNLDYEKVIRMLEQFDSLIIKSASNILVKDI
ncbi:MAG: YihY/virulence factor BrkB family protein [Bacteroidales bacterium]|jgi:membrane protein|nr:YihY/virulence factor BrkB family protein [Bacteroidales bacterium]